MNRGFSLLELVLVLLIGGIILAGVFSAIQIYLRDSGFDTTRERQEVIDEALQLYLSIYGEYPCPAPMDENPDSANFGMEDCTLPVIGTAPDQVVSGAVPTRTLDIADEYATDSWGNKFRYVVTFDMLDPATFDAMQGAVEVIDTAGRSVTNYTANTAVGTAHYAVISHGPDESGATPLNAAVARACVTGRADSDNCNADRQFIYSEKRSFTEDNKHYDDILQYRENSSLPGIPDNAVVAFDTANCPPGWVDFWPSEGRSVVGGGVRFPLRQMGGITQLDIATGIGIEPEISPRFKTSAELGSNPVDPQNFDYVVPESSFPTTVTIAEPGSTESIPYVALKHCSTTAGFSSGAGSVDGVCGADVNTCTAGSFNDTADTASEYRWECNGLGSGSTASCSSPITGSGDPDGVCGTSLNSCTAGTLNDIADTTSEYRWECVGTSTTDSCSIAKSSSSSGGSGGGGGCFAADTRIAMADGSEKLITELEVGDMVMSFDKSAPDNTLEPGRISHIYLMNEKEVYTLPNGTKVTDSHKFMTASGAMKSIRDMNADDLLVLASGETIPHGDMKPAGMEKTYNFTVAGNHSYIANDLRAGNMTVKGLPEGVYSENELKAFVVYERFLIK